MLLDIDIEIKWSNRNRKIYEGKGYVFTGYSETFLLKQAIKYLVDEVDCFKEIQIKKYK